MTDVLLSEDNNGVRLLTLNRPDSFNALTVELKERLLEALRQAAADDSVRAVVITGAGKAFCAGQDLKEHVAMLEANDPTPLKTVEEHYNPLIKTVTSMPKPVIAAVNGTAAGAGASLAFACDLRIASDNAKFLMAFANVALSADSGASWTLPRLIGYGRAMEMMLLAEPVDAQEALRIGMVNRVVPRAELEQASMALAQRIAQAAPFGLHLIKRSLNRTADAQGFRTALAAHFDTHQLSHLSEAFRQVSQRGLAQAIQRNKSGQTA